MTMRFPNLSSPHVVARDGVGAMMRRVMYALVPGTAACVAFFGWGVLVNIALASVTALASEALMLRLRGRPVAPFLMDGSALLTAVLLGLALPSLAPWWLTVVATAFAIVIAKQLYGGLGYNPFNPAMIGYVVALISFPKEMTSWLTPHLGGQLDLLQTLAAQFSGHLPSGLHLDAISSATPLDTMKTQLKLSHTLTEIQAGPAFGSFGGVGWEWVGLGYLAGGLWLLYRGVIRWHIPLGVLGGLAVMALIFNLVDSDAYASPLVHLFSGGAMLGAFFIATDPITASTTERGRLIYGAGIGILTYIIRTWGGYPDGIAFAVLLMNMAAPTIDYYTRPRVFGDIKTTESSE
jgi:electron transport complex protein RnfD